MTSGSGIERRPNAVLDGFPLNLLRCPLTRSRLDWLSRDQIAHLNRLIAEGELETGDGATVRRPVDQALANADRSAIAPVRNGVIVLVADELIKWPAGL